jgi:hypothetical protein
MNRWIQKNKVNSCLSGRTRYLQKDHRHTTDVQSTETGYNDIRTPY